MVVVGLDRERAVAELARLAPPARQPRRGRGARAAIASPSSRRPRPSGSARSSRRPPAAGMSRVVMFVYNDCRNDARVLREAARSSHAGYDVTIMARPSSPRSKEVEREQRDGFEIVRIPIPRRSATRTWVWVRQTWRTKGWIFRWVDVPREAGDRPSATAHVVQALLAVLFGLLMIPWAILQRLPYVVLQLFHRERLPGTATLDWLWRWRQTILGWANACAEAAPLADVYHGHDLTGLPAALCGGPAQRRARRVRQPRDLPRGGLDRAPAALGALVLPAPRAGLDRRSRGARDRQPLARGGPAAAATSRRRTVVRPQLPVALDRAADAAAAPDPDGARPAPDDARSRCTTAGSRPHRGLEELAEAILAARPRARPRRVPRATAAGATG